jgi:hypothetical protein
MSRVVNFNVDVDPARLFDWVGGCRSGANYNSRVNVIDKGDRFVSTLHDNVYYAAYYHPTKGHSATVEGGNLPWDKTYAKSTADPGKWAVAYGQNRWSGNNRTWYDAW